MRPSCQPRRSRPPRNAQDLQAYRLPQPKPFLASLSIEAVLILLYHFVLVESILNTYQSMCPLDAEQASDSRQKIARYIETLASAGHHDAEQLTIYGLAYLTELHEEQDPRFTGC